MGLFKPANTPPHFFGLPKLTLGDKVSIVASSAQLATQFPHVYEFGIQRLQNLFQLVPRELPTTCANNSSLESRAQDLMRAFCDPETKAIISLIGGHEQILMLPFLDPEILKNNPKPFFGYSDNTNLSLYLWSLGIPSYYGGSIFTEFAMSGKMNSFTEKYLRLALFESCEIEIESSQEFTDHDNSWSDLNYIHQEYEYEKNEGWFWDGLQSGEGILWGGCLEIIALQLLVNKWLPSPEAISGTVLCLETTELIPDPWIVSHLLIGLGERGYLSQLSGLLVGRPKARAIFGKQPSSEERKNYRSEQRENIIREFRKYNKVAPIVMNLDFGHTKPQIPLPFGKIAKIDCINQEIKFKF